LAEVDGDILLKLEALDNLRFAVVVEEVAQVEKVEIVPEWKGRDM
jgi:hypothetical protein